MNTIELASKVLNIKTDQAMDQVKQIMTVGLDMGFTIDEELESAYSWLQYHYMGFGEHIKPMIIRELREFAENYKPESR